MTQLKMYVPDNADNAEDTQEYVNGAMCEQYGGTTVYSATGSWKDPNGRIVTEPVSVYETFTDNSAEKCVSFMDELAYQVKRRTNEDSVAYSINNDMFFEWTNGSTTF